MKPRTTIILISLLVLAALAVGISRLVAMWSKDKAAPAPQRLFAETPSGAKKLTIESFDGGKLIFVRSDGKWQMIEPRVLSARSEPLDAVVRAMTHLDYQRAFDPNTEADCPEDSLTGLDKPLWTVSLVDEKDKTFTLFVGRGVPEVGGGVEETYVRPAGEHRSFVVARNMAGLLGLNPDEYRDMTVLKDLNRPDIIALRIEGRQNYTLEKKRGGWDIVNPFPARADPVAVSRLLGELTSLKAERRLAEKPVSLKPFGLERPRLLVHVIVRPQPHFLVAATTPATAPGERTYTLLLGNSRGKSICAKLKRHPEVFTIPAAALDKLQPALAGLQSQTLLAFMPSQVDGIEVRQGTEHLALKRNGRWRMIQPFPGPVDDKPVDALLKKLVELKVQQWITPQTIGRIDITSPKATITLDLPQEDKKLSLLVGGKDPSGKLVYCKQSGASAVGTVGEDQIKAILRPAGHYWSKDLLKLPPGAEIISLSIDRPDGGYVLVRQGDQWLLTAPVKAPADAKQVRTILDQLRCVRAEKIVALGKTVPPQYASTEHRAVVSLGVTGLSDAKNAAGATQKHPPEKTIMKTYRLVVVQTDKGCFAWVENPAVTVVGRCSADLYDSLTGRLENSGKIAE